MGEEESPSFHEDLRSVLNQHSIENGANIPDFILAAYLIDCLKALNEATKRRDYFFDFKPFTKTGD